MKSIKKVILTLFGSLLVNSFLQAQSLIYLGFFDTNDAKIGVNKAAEKRQVFNEMNIVADALSSYGYSFDPHIVDGEYCSKESLMEELELTPISSNDVVFFYYGGHGGRSTNDTDPFPQMCLGSSFESDFVPATLVKNIIMKKNPRFAVIISACCNSEDSGISVKSISAEAPYTKESDINKEAIKKMFLDQKGYVQVTSSKAGEYSWSGPEGGVFCLSFWRLFKDVESGKMAPAWGTLCEAVKKDVVNTDIKTRDGIVHQEPYYVINGSNSTNTIIDPNRKVTTITTRINNQTSTLQDDINKLLDHQISTDQRLQMIPSILKNQFKIGAKVTTVGTDMKTMVDYEDAEVFLRRITLSPYITQVNILSGDGGGLKASIIVHEVRKR